MTTYSETMKRRTVKFLSAFGFCLGERSWTLPRLSRK